MRWKRTGILVLAAAAVLAAGCVVHIKQTKEEFPAVEWIAAREKEDVGAVEAALAARDQKRQEELSAGEQQEEQKEEKSLKQRFAGAVLVGDSVATGFIDYAILDPASVVAQRGMRADTAGEDIAKALDLSPNQLFLSIGLNDMEYCLGDSGRFVASYEKRLQEIRDRAPELPIYVNAIMPVLPQAVEKKPVLEHVDAFNEALKEMCGRWNITFVDSRDLLEGHEDWYQKDSVHLKSTPYPFWLERMEEAAGL